MDSTFSRFLCRRLQNDERVSDTHDFKRIMTIDMLVEDWNRLIE